MCGGVLGRQSVHSALHFDPQRTAGARAEMTSTESTTPTRKSPVSSASGQSAWHDVAAAVACFTSVAAASGGLIHAVVGAQLALLGGIVTGLVATKGVPGALVGGVATGFGAFAGSLFAYSPISPLHGARTQEVVIAAIGAAVVAYGVGFARGRVKHLARVLCLTAIALLIGNMWWTAATIVSQPTKDSASQTAYPALIDILSERPSFEISRSDNMLNAIIAREVHDGVPYYPAFTDTFEQLYQQSPSTPSNIRFPMLAYIWGALGGRGTLWTYLVLATIGVIAAAFGASRLVTLPLVVPACALLSAYFLYFGLSIVVYTPEPWAAVFALVSFAGYAVSIRSERWRSAIVVAAGSAVFATLVKEVLVYVPLAGFASTFARRDGQSRFRTVAWMVALGVLVAALGAHYFVAAGHIDPNSGYEQLSKGSLDNVVAGILFSTELLGRSWLPILAAISGVVGSAVVPDRRFRANLVACLVLPLIAFLLFSNSAASETGVTINYWGAAVTPLFFACMPLVFQLVPGAAREVA